MAIWVVKKGLQKTFLLYSLILFETKYLFLIVFLDAGLLGFLVVWKDVSC